MKQILKTWKMTGLCIALSLTTLYNIYLVVMLLATTKYPMIILPYTLFFILESALTAVACIGGWQMRKGENLSGGASKLRFTLIFDLVFMIIGSVFAIADSFEIASPSNGIGGLVALVIRIYFIVLGVRVYLVCNQVLKAVKNGRYSYGRDLSKYLFDRSSVYTVYLGLCIAVSLCNFTSFTALLGVVFAATGSFSAVQAISGQYGVLAGVLSYFSMSQILEFVTILFVTLCAGEYKHYHEKRVSDGDESVREK